MIQLPWNEKQIYRLNFRPQMGPPGLTLTMTLTLNFLGQTRNLLYLSQKWSDYPITKFRHTELMLGEKWAAALLSNDVKCEPDITASERASDVGVMSTHLIAQLMLLQKINPCEWQMRLLYVVAQLVPLWQIIECWYCGQYAIMGRHHWVYYWCNGAHWPIIQQLYNAVPLYRVHSVYVPSQWEIV